MRFPIEDQVARVHSRTATAKSAPAKSPAAFGLKNADRAELKRMLRELRRRPASSRSAARSCTSGRAARTSSLADITGRDERRRADRRRPTEWDEERTAPPPKIRIRRAAQGATPARRRRRRRPRAAADRRSSHDGRRDRAYHGRVIKILDSAKQRALGIFALAPAAERRRRPAHAGRQEAARPRARDPAGRDDGRRRTATSSRSS